MKADVEADFMENAGREIAHATYEYIQQNCLVPFVWLLCGKGNNAGDAFVAGRYLLQHGCKVIAIQFEDLSHCSPLCKQNRRLFQEMKGHIINEISDFGTEGVILDGIFGTGFKGKIEAPYAPLIEKVNHCGLPILAIDIPSGLNGITGEAQGNVIQATETIFLGLPKTGFFLGDGWNVTGKLRGVDFGLPSSIVDRAQADFHLITQEHAASLVPSIQRNRHKYQAGYVIGLAGSPTMPGAALLSTWAALRAGSGMVRLLHPEGMEKQLSSSPYELIKIPYSDDQPKSVVEWMEKAAATFVGPGIGRTDQTKLSAAHRYTCSNQTLCDRRRCLNSLCRTRFPTAASSSFDPSSWGNASIVAFF